MLKDAETLRLPSGSPDLTGTDDKSSEPNPGFNLTESYSIPPKTFQKGETHTGGVKWETEPFGKPKHEIDQI